MTNSSQSQPARRFMRIFIAVFVIATAGALLIRQVSKSSSASQNEAATLPAKVCDSTAKPAFFAAPEGFGAIFPCEPQRTVETVNTVMGTLPVVHYVAEASQGHYDLLYTDYSAFFNGDLDGILRSIVLSRFKDESLVEFNVAETAAKTIKLDVLEGEEITGSKDGRTIRFQVFVVGKKLFRIAIVAPSAEITNSEYTEFLASIKIVATK